MSPEIVKKKPYTKKTDVWSLGILIIEMLDGVPPYFNMEPVNAIYMIAVRGRPDIQKKNLSPDLEDLLNKCLEVDQDKRASSTELMVHNFFNSCTNLSFLESQIKVALRAAANDH